MCHAHSRELCVVCLTLHWLGISTGVRVAAAFTPAAEIKHALAPLRVSPTILDIKRSHAFMCGVQENFNHI